MEAGWRLRRYDLGRRCNYEMAVWERFGEEASGGSERGSKKKKIRRAILGRIRDCFERSWVEESLAVLVIFRCV